MDVWVDGQTTKRKRSTKSKTYSRPDSKLEEIFKDRSKIIVLKSVKEFGQTFHSNLANSFQVREISGLNLKQGLEFKYSFKHECFIGFKTQGDNRLF